MFQFVQALGWLPGLLRLERLLETEGLLVGKAGIVESRTGARSGVRSLISTSLITLGIAAAGLGADGKVADCSCIAD